MHVPSQRMFRVYFSKCEWHLSWITDMAFVMDYRHLGPKHNPPQDSSDHRNLYISQKNGLKARKALIRGLRAKGKKE